MGLTGLKAIQAALFHMKPSKANSVMGRFNDDYSGDSANAIAAINKEIEAIEKKKSLLTIDFKKSKMRLKKQTLS